MARTPGLRKITPGWKDDSLYRRRRPVTTPPVPRSAEQIERSTQAFLDAMNERLKSYGQKSLEKIVDQEARIAIEGDTAMDDVPFGETGE
ncbi:hypothetical protein [Devosia soli]|nr:hypothetical protein [Devosia soli]